MAKDWIGNENAVKSTIGIAVFKDSKREDNDFYATEPKALELLLDIHKFSKNVWECACGCNTLVNVLKKRGFNVRFSDIKSRKRGIEKLDFLSSKNKQLYKGDIITNPPYKFASEFILKGLSLLPKGNQLALFMPTRYLSGQKRGEIFKKYPPKIIYVASKRLVCSKNGDFTHNRAALMDYAWFIWEKGFKGNTIIKWFN